MPFLAHTDLCCHLISKQRIVIENIITVNLSKRRYIFWWENWLSDQIIISCHIIWHKSKNKFNSYGFIDFHLNVIWVNIIIIKLIEGEINFDSAINILIKLLQGRFYYSNKKETFLSIIYLRYTQNKGVILKCLTKVKNGN